MSHYSIAFNNTNKISWLTKIAVVKDSLDNNRTVTDVSLEFDHSLDTDAIMPTHLVSLACLIEFCDRKGLLVSLTDRHTNRIADYLWTNLGFAQYWSGGQNYVPAKDQSILNLWRIKDEEKEVHSQKIYEYLKREFFGHKDLSAVKNSLDEAYYNIFDHAEAGGNAFSAIKYDEQKKKLHVAVCDFGIGIAKSVRSYFTSINDDATAIEKAMEYNFTTKSQLHNMGMGLGNIKDTCTEDDYLGIISNNGILVYNSGKNKTTESTIFFPGTLIYYELSLSHFEDEEIIDTFEL